MQEGESDLFVIVVKAKEAQGRMSDAVRDYDVAAMAIVAITSQEKVLDPIRTELDINSRVIKVIEAGGIDRSMFPPDIMHLSERTETLQHILQLHERGLSLLSGGAEPLGAVAPTSSFRSPESNGQGHNLGEESDGENPLEIERNELLEMINLVDTTISVNDVNIVLANPDRVATFSQLCQDLQSPWGASLGAVGLDAREIARLRTILSNHKLPVVIETTKDPKNHMIFYYRLRKEIPELEELEAERKRLLRAIKIVDRHVEFHRQKSFSLRDASLALWKRFYLDLKEPWVDSKGVSLSEVKEILKVAGINGKEVAGQYIRHLNETCMANHWEIHIARSQDDEGYVYCRIKEGTPNLPQRSKRGSQNGQEGADKKVDGEKKEPEQPGSGFSKDSVTVYS